MKIIDCRLRPPIGKHAQNFLCQLLPIEIGSL